MQLRPERRGYVLDVALAGGVAVLVLAGVLAVDSAGGGRTPLDWTLLVVSAGSLAVRRRFPVSVLAVTSVCLLAYYLRIGPDPAVAVPGVIAHYTAVAAGQRLRSVLAATPYLLGTLLAGPTALAEGASTFGTAQARVLALGWFVAAGVMGQVVVHRRAYVAEVEQRALDAERTREEAARRRAAEERLHIARELHDALTHSISVITMQSGVAIHLLTKRGEEVPPALAAIQEASGDAMRELRTTLEVLRDPASADDRSGLDRLPQLLDRARAAGLEVTAHTRGHPGPLSSAVDRVAYRIIQEALTNVSKHVGPAAVIVQLDYQGDCLTVQVDDDGRGAPGMVPVPGVGLVGMRERVTALGGALAVGPGRDGGFSVRAQLPLTAAVPGG